jgi:hypothetical protein
MLGDEEVVIIKTEADARLEVAKNRSAALIKEADAELNNSNNMEGMRRHTEKMEMNRALKKLAKKGHMVVSGDNGDKVLNFYNDTLDTINKR